MHFYVASETDFKRIAEPFKADRQFGVNAFSNTGVSPGPARPTRLVIGGLPCHLDGALQRAGFNRTNT